MTESHLLRYIIEKLNSSADEYVIKKNGAPMTLGDVFKSLHLSAYDLSLDTLDVRANNTFCRFDRFNLKYNPAGQSMLREIFLKTDNLLGGKYMAEITEQVMNQLDASKYTMVEWRISIYGRSIDEWQKLAKWFCTYQMAHENVRWLIQIPRLFDSYLRNGDIKSFEEMLNNIFEPLFAATLNPEENKEIDIFLDAIVGFDSVDDESRPEFGTINSGSHSLPNPNEWTHAHNPPYGYWLYYTHANICVLNQLRSSRGLSTFSFRPHCGEAGDPEHLISAYILAHQINHGILLKQLPALNYLYYLSQVGIAISPLSNSKLFLEYNKNPFIKYFRQGLNISLSSDDPLMLHSTSDPLLEEYSVATHVRI
jgi:AMP deaminase